jgi:hypothetical protein
MVRNTWRAIEASTGKIIERWAAITPPSEIAQSVRAGDEVEKRD